MITVYPPLAVPARHRHAAFPFDRPALRLTHLGRGAAWLALRALGLGPGSKLAMPAYHCGSEVEAVRLAGVDVVFYRVDGSLRVDEDDLARVARDADAVYVISHFGFPLVPVAADVPVIADAAHALFSMDASGAALGDGSDAAVFCPRKSLGVPDGGAVLVGEGVSVIGHAPRRRIVRSVASLAVGRASLSRVAPVRRLADRLVRRASRSDAAAARGELTEAVIGEWDLSVDDMEVAARAPSRLTAWAVRRVDADEIRARRRRNYETLLADLGELCPEPYRALPEGVCPLYLPVVSGERDRVIRDLLAHGVRAIEVWPVPHPLLDRERFAELEPIRRGLLALPIHQLLREEHVDSVRRAAKAVLG